MIWVCRTWTKSKFLNRSWHSLLVQDASSPTLLWKRLLTVMRFVKIWHACSRSMRRLFFPICVSQRMTFWYGVIRDCCPVMRHSPSRNPVGLFADLLSFCHGQPRNSGRLDNPTLARLSEKRSERDEARMDYTKEVRPPFIIKWCLKLRPAFIDIECALTIPCGIFFNDCIPTLIYCTIKR